ncbi:MFS transporter [Klebsiella pneumoniae]|uniref:MFS transporter n=1 Tax=Klebsiella pneumoniae TaxID=573 RepID=UPI00388E0354
MRFSATIYLVCFCFFKQLAMIFMRLFWRAICMKASVSRALTCVLGLVALGFTFTPRVHA